MRENYLSDGYVMTWLGETQDIEEKFPHVITVQTLIQPILFQRINLV